MLVEGFNAQLAAEMQRLQLKQIPVLIEMRRDLGLTAEIHDLEEQMKQQWTKLAATYGAGMDEVKKLLEQDD